MLLKLIKIRPMSTGTLCELWEINVLWGNKLLAEVLIMDEQMPLELIYRLTVTCSGICLQGKPAAWIWASYRMEVIVTDYLLQIQRSREEIRVDVCRPVPDLPGYPYVDYHPDDYPVVIGLDDIPEEEFEELVYEIDDRNLD